MSSTNPSLAGRVPIVAAAALAILAALAGCGGSQSKPRADEEIPARLATQEGRMVFADDGDITAINPDGSGRVKLTETPEAELQPRWSPDGRRIAFVRDDGGVYVMNADGSRTRRVTGPHEGVETPAWSADSRRLAFSAAAGDGFALYVVSVDGSGLRRLASVKRGFAGAPDWSPDGKRLAFQIDRSTEGGQQDIYVMKADGSAMRRITRSRGDETSAHWSPDGRWVLYGAGQRGIYRIKPDGTRNTRILADRRDAAGLLPVWSPDGQRIAWTAKLRDASSSEIFVMNADGTGVRAITDRLLAEAPVDW